MPPSLCLKMRPSLAREQSPYFCPAQCDNSLSMLIVIIATFAGLLIGAGICFSVSKLYRGRLKNLAQNEADELLSEAKAEADAFFEEAKSRLADYEEELQEKFEKETAPLVQRIRDRESDLDEKEQDLKIALSRREDQFRRESQGVRDFEQKVVRVETRFRDRKKTYEAAKNKYVDGLLTASSASLDEMKTAIRNRVESELVVQATRQAQLFEEEFQQEAERSAKQVLYKVIDRFARAYCSERGIGNVDFGSMEHLQRTLGPERKFVKKLEAECGVDVNINEQYISASILGFDPVRRELGRASLEKMANDRNLTEARVTDIVANCKRELFRKIRNDGNRIAQELRVSKLSDEIRNMMGALRYRYSFAQNQYFHCGEVGFLCGLLSSELGLPIEDGRRAGLLHDIGKAMDHSIDGGHAVIGADFIQKNGEAPHIVHAVRAHHHDETPSTDLAFLVIAADAISGARPGARRSTIDSYTQKMADLEKIGSSFEGVIGTYIMSAGREVRVVVDSHQVDDHEALRLSQAIAKRIEEECSYPGLIKVTVVREIQAIDYAK